MLVPIPFTDLSSTKRRPVVVISNDKYNRGSQDCIVVAMTSNVIPTEYGLLVDPGDLETGKLNRSSQIRCDKIYTLAQSIVVKKFGKINNATFGKIQAVVSHLFES